MNFIQEFRELVKNILVWIYFLLAFSAFFFIFGIKKIALFGINLFLPFPSVHSISASVFETIQRDLLPNGVQLIVTEPLGAFLAQVMISVWLALIATFPIFLYKILKYLLPALFEHERRAILKILVPSSVLFAGGCLFGYFILIPPTFKILYSYTFSLNITPFFAVNSFIYLVLGLMALGGVIFLLPVFMYLLTRFGVVRADFWKKNWRYAILVFLIFSAIITPDGTGITMLILSFPLTGLYFLGSLISQTPKS